MFHCIVTVVLVTLERCWKTFMESSVILSKYTKNGIPPTMISQGFCLCKSTRRCLNNENIEP